ncbi:zinc dependent phospholipase C family protein [Pedobacter sp. AW1-32]|uniref:zinc dependent phospholipase C family protein n=1 Tax=Pedobacter sp. AW1-32 TaxID=3383026 RepID=UPI003FEEBE76
MKRLTIKLALIIPLFLNTSWGFFAHKKMNNLAVFTLPQAMIRFYKNNIRYLTEHSIDPDKRRYIDTLEAPRHYLDVENYESNIDSIPTKWEFAVQKYSVEKLNKNGILPWHIQKTYNYLVHAFKLNDSLKILKHSADLGHYIADAHVPLHTSANHNGQLSNQIGIHAFWESRLPELFADNYNFFVGRATYIENPLTEAWKIVKHTHGLVDTVLTFEKKLSESFPSDKKYSFSRRGNIVLKQYAVDYSKAYENIMDKMVERQMRATILSIGSFWYSAWIDAGQPDLKNMKKMETPDDGPEFHQRVENGKIIGREI